MEEEYSDAMHTSVDKSDFCCLMFEAIFRASSISKTRAASLLISYQWNYSSPTSFFL